MSSAAASDAPPGALPPTSPKASSAHPSTWPSSGPSAPSSASTPPPRPAPRSGPGAARTSASDAADWPGLPPLLQHLAARGVERSYRKGTLLIEEGSQGDSLYLLISGRVRVFSADARGREVIYGFHGPGEYVGEMSLDGGPRCASVITESACRCVLLTRDSLLAHLRESPEFGLALITTLIQRLRAATRSTRQLALNDVYGRLKVLLEDPDLSDHRLTHQAMAQRLGCSREMVSRLIKDLEQGGYLVKAERGRYERVRSLPARW